MQSLVTLFSLAINYLMPDHRTSMFGCIGTLIMIMNDMCNITKEFVFLVRRRRVQNLFQQGLMMIHH